MVRSKPKRVRPLPKKFYRAVAKDVMWEVTKPDGWKYFMDDHEALVQLIVDKLKKHL